MARNLLCTECGGTMQEGYIPSFIPFEGLPPPIWVEGKPEKSFWVGWKMEDKAPKYPVLTYRCAKCGFLKFYAGPDNSKYAT